MRTIATICARGGSQGVPGKNIRPLCGKPLIAHTIEQALECRRLDAVYVSTDSEAIAEAAKAAGATVPFLRPAQLATASAPKIPVIAHLVEHVEKAGERVDRIVDLDPTSPLRDLADIDACIALLDDDTDVVITAYESDKNPYFNMVEQRADGTVGLAKPPPSEIAGRQSAPRVYSMNASIYVWHRHTLSKGLWNGRTRLHVMPRERSIDIDSEIDFRLVELLMQQKTVATQQAREGGCR
jgi:CMP-N,N'-diacetyllegionaminic acid synthase